MVNVQIQSIPVSLSVTLGLMFSASAFAQDATKTDETMVVTAAGYAQVIQNAPASISVISREDLESRYYRDVTDALKSVPGVTVTGGRYYRHQHSWYGFKLYPYLGGW